MSEPPQEQKTREGGWRRWLSRARQPSSGDVIAGQVGEGSQGVAFGKNIIQIGTLVIPMVPFIILTMTVVLGILGVFGTFAYQSWRASQPVPMTKSFNIAVAAFGEQAGEGQPVRVSADGAWLSDRVYERLATALSADADLQRVVEVRHANIGPLRGQTRAQRAAEANELAERLNATVVIYGTLDVRTPNVFVPEFYVAEAYRGAPELTGDFKVTGSGFELTGQNAFGDPIRVNLSLSEQTRLDAEEKIGPRAQALSLFTLGLAYLSIDRPDKALDYLERAEKVPGWTDTQGKEVLYLFKASTLVARRTPDDLKLASQEYERALELTQRQYARAFIGLGNVLYAQATDRGRIDFQRLDQAIGLYQEALNASDKPAGAYVEAKALFNMGLAYATKARFSTGACPDPTTMDTLKRAIAEYAKDGSIPLAQDIGAKAYYQLGLVYEACADQYKRQQKTAEAITLYADAQAAYKQCEVIATPPVRQAAGFLGLPFLALPARTVEEEWRLIRWPAQHRQAYTLLARAELGQTTLYQEAVNLYSGLTTPYETGRSAISDELAAEAYFNLGLAREALGDKTLAREAYQRVKLVTSKETLRAKAEQRLQQMGGN